MKAQEHVSSSSLRQQPLKKSKIIWLIIISQT